MTTKHIETEVFEAYEGNSVTIECPIAGDSTPSLDIQWLQNGRPISPGVKHTISPDRTRLVVMNVRREDSANFCCRVSNFAGETSAQCRLSIMGKSI